MTRVVIVVPELVRMEEPVLDRDLPNLSALAERSRVFRLSRLDPVETPEARLLGLRPADAALRQGPLTVAALGADPPPRSLHFHLSLMSFVEDVAANPDQVPTPEELRELVSAAAKLNTRTLTFVAGSGLDHGLVWESLGDLATTPAHEVVAKSLKGFYPEGDGESMLRQYIDDSVNLLSELDFNRRRLDEGEMPLNLLWPWGHGVRTPVPNLALRRSSPCFVMSSSLRLAGLSRLAGYRHCEVGWLGIGLQTRLEAAIAKSLGEASAILVVDAIVGFRQTGELDEAAYFARRLDSEAFGPILELATLEPVRILFASPLTEALGLAFQFDSQVKAGSSNPFDERSIDERSLSLLDLESAVCGGLEV